MANPLAILGAIAQTGAQGLAGGLEGKFEGEEIRRKHLSEDQANQMRALEMMLTQQKLRQGMQSEDIIQGGYIFRKNPMTGALTPIGPVPQGPPTGLQRAQEESARATATLHGRQAEEYGKPKAVTALDEARAEAARATAGLHAAQTAEVGREKPGTPLQEYLRRVKPQNVAEYLKAVRGFSTATQKPSTALTPRETVTTTTKITPRKQITNVDDFARINNAVPAIVDEITGQFARQGLNFNVPGAWVKLPSGKLVRKEDVIAQALRDRVGIEATVRWEGPPAGSGWLGGRGAGRFVVTKAWEPGSREPIESRRTIGPPGSSRQETAEDEEE